MHEGLLYKKIYYVEIGEYRIAFDGSSSHRCGGVGVVLYGPNGTNISLYFKLEFLCSNSRARYEALIVRLISAL